MSTSDFELPAIRHSQKRYSELECSWYIRGVTETTVATGRYSLLRQLTATAAYSFQLQQALELVAWLLELRGGTQHRVSIRRVHGRKVAVSLESNGSYQ